MDFFNAAADPATDAVSLPQSEDKSDVSDFAQAIADRFGRTASLFTARLPSITSPPARQPSSAGPPIFPPVAPADLDSWLSDPSALIVDIRPHAAHTSARIPHAISLCVPSTLLKRPLFSLQKLCAMLPSPSARARFSAWRSSSRILVYDADSHAISESSNISGLLRKFKADGFQGDLAWLKGGFQVVWKDRRDIVDTNPPDPENDDDDDEHDKSSQSKVLRTRHLPMAAFSLSSTSIHGSPFSAKQRQHPPQLGRPSSQSTSSSSFHASNPFFDAIRQNIELSHGITERIPLQLPRRVRRRIRELPFPWLQDIAKCAAPAPRRPRTLSDNSTTSDSESEDDSDIPNATEIDEFKETLATQFHKIESTEQKRLMGIMERHSRESGHPLVAAVAPVSEQPQKLVAFPFSITAGVEKGAKNRYRHIWPFEHARVRLHQKKGADDDYINASYVQPLGTSRRYIATQGPLPATFTDFWTLCWEQNVHVIVMLTREVEGATVKCGSYWTDTEFGPLRLKLVSTVGLAPSEERSHTAQSLQLPVSSSKRMVCSVNVSKRLRRHDHYRTTRSETVKRTFELTHTGYPEAKPRKIVHLQYLEWPDMNVPDDPRGVLGLIKQVDEAVRETREGEEVQEGDDGRKTRRRRKGAVCTTEVDEKTGVAKHAMGSNSPVLLHCSAGVGRTGGFIIVDAVLDAVRIELRAKYRAKKEEMARVEQAKKSDDKDRMDLDVKPEVVGVEVHPQTIPVQVSSGASSAPSTDNLGSGQDDQKLVVHVPLVTVPMGMEVDHSHSEGTTEEASPSPPPPDHKFNKAGTIRWAENVRDETGVEGERVSERLAQSRKQAIVSTDRALYASGSSSRTGSNPELVVQSNGNSSSSSANGDRTSRSSGGGGVYSTTTSLATSVSGASTTSSVVGGSKEQVHIGDGTENEETADASSSRSSSLPLSQEQEQNTISSLSSFASSEGEPPSRSMSPPDELSRNTALPLQLLHHHPVGQGTSVETYVTELEAGDMYASEASVAQTIEAPSTGETVAGQSGGRFDYKEPRPLHENYTPPLLSTFEDPISEVVQDMREQRMSLCQSLRQYVFVHAAVIEGSLMVLDEERELAEGIPRWTGPRDEGDERMDDNDTEMMRMRTTPEFDEESLMLRFSSPPPASSSDSGASTPSIGSVANIGHPSPLPSRSPSRSRSRSRRRRHYQHHHHLPVPSPHPHSSPSQNFLYSNDTVVPPSFASSSYSYSYSYGKRPSSPTELLKEDKKGGVMLSKRPSIERKRRNPSGGDRGVVRVSLGAAASSGIGDCGQER